MTSPLSVTLLLGSPNPTGSGATIAAWLQRQLAPMDDLKLEAIDLHTPAGDRRAAIDRADAVIIVTPEFNHSFPGALKSAIDELRTEWFGTAVGLVTYGGAAGGARAAEALRLVLSELHTVTIRDGVSFPQAHEAFDEHGEPVEPVAAERRLHRFLEVLRWWAWAARDARSEQPYPA